MPLTRTDSSRAALVSRSTPGSLDSVMDADFLKDNNPLSGWTS